jgi:aquacobalamin reductase/NAD(P)H-flavin reductase
MAVNCKILELRYLNPKTLSVSLESESDFDFLAGQYVLLELGKSGKLPFSIASSPKSNREFELHLGGVSKESSLANGVMYLQRCFQNGKTVVVEEAKGNAWLRPTDGKIVLVAGGSGYSYTRSLLHEAIKQNQESEITLYWGAYSENDLYEHDYLVELEAAYSGFTYIPITESISNNIVAHHGRLLDIVYEDFDFNTPADLYICGRYEMVQAAYSHINNVYEGQLNIYSDALPAA